MDTKTFFPLFYIEKTLNFYMTRDPPPNRKIVLYKDFKIVSNVFTRISREVRFTPRWPRDLTAFCKCKCQIFILFLVTGNLFIRYLILQ